MLSLTDIWRSQSRNQTVLQKIISMLEMKNSLDFYFTEYEKKNTWMSAQTLLSTCSSPMTKYTCDQFTLGWLLLPEIASKKLIGTLAEAGIFKYKLIFPEQSIVRYFTKYRRDDDICFIISLPSIQLTNEIYDWYGSRTDISLSQKTKMFNIFRDQYHINPRPAANGTVMR